MIKDFFNSEQVQELGKNAFGTAFIVGNISEYFGSYSDYSLKTNNLSGVSTGENDHTADYADMAKSNLLFGGNSSIITADYDEYVNLPIESVDNINSATHLLNSAVNASSATLKRKMFSSVFGKIHGLAGHNLTVSSATDYETFITEMTSNLDSFDAPQLGRYAVLPSQACFAMVKDDVLDNRFEMGANQEGYFGFYGNVMIFSGGSVSHEGGHVRFLGGIKNASNAFTVKNDSRIIDAEGSFAEKIQMRNVYGVGVNTPQWVAKATIS